MERLTICWTVLLTLISVASSAVAQSSFPVGAVVGIVFGIFSLCLGVGLPICIWICIFCGAAHASKRQNQRPVNAFVVTPSNTPRPPPGSYPTQPSSTAAYPVQPSTQPYPAHNPAYPVQQDIPYPSAPPYSGYPTSQYPDAPPPYVPPADEKQPV